MHIKSDRQVGPAPEATDCGCRNVALGGEPGGDAVMMMTETKWPGWPVLPSLLLFAGLVLLVAFILLEVSGSGDDGETVAGTGSATTEGSRSR